MKLVLQIGGNVVALNYEDSDCNAENGNETDVNWGNVAQNLFFPALRALGYVIDNDWVDGLEDDHRDHLDPFNRINRRR